MRSPRRAQCYGPMTKCTSPGMRYWGCPALTDRADNSVGLHSWSFGSGRFRSRRGCGSPGCCAAGCRRPRACRREPPRTGRPGYYPARLRPRHPQRRGRCRRHLRSGRQDLGERLLADPFSKRPTRIRTKGRKWPFSWEPPIGIEPMTYALREACSLAACALAAPIHVAPVIALMTPAALGLSADSVHEPVHTGGEKRAHNCDRARWPHVEHRQRWCSTHSWDGGRRRSPHAAQEEIRETAPTWARQTGASR